MPPDNPPANIDVAVNIFAKPWQTALALLSLLKQSGPHIAKIWLQYEPVASQYDKAPPYGIYEYLKEKGLADCAISQPGHWIDLNAAEPKKFGDSAYRHGLRYQVAFEHSRASLLFVMHNDVFILRDILGAMRQEIGDAFAIGELGQCWNCPAADAELTRAVLGREPCRSDSYQDFRISAAELKSIYAEAHKRQKFARPYDSDGFRGDFENRPWPLPECRINEWACLINLDMTRQLAQPFGPAFPFGAYKPCGSLNLDIGVAWFRDLHNRGLYAKNFKARPDWLKHWVGTGNNTPIRYARLEDNAQRLLAKHFPAYTDWLRERYGILT